MAITVMMKVSPRARNGIMRLARQQKTRAWVILDSLLPAALLESNSSSIQQKPKDAHKSAKISRVLPIPQETT